MATCKWVWLLTWFSLSNLNGCDSERPLVTLWGEEDRLTHHHPSHSSPPTIITPHTHHHSPPPTIITPHTHHHPHSSPLTLITTHTHHLSHSPPLTLITPHTHHHSHSSPLTLVTPHTHHHRLGTHAVVIGGCGVLVAGYDLRGHPVWCPDERVPLPNGPIQLSRYPKVHWRV